MVPYLRRLTAAVSVGVRTARWAASILQAVVKVCHNPIGSFLYRLYQSLRNTLYIEKR